MTDIHAILASMTLEEKVGQLFVARRPQDDADAMKAITDYHLGGFTLYACDYEHRTPEDIRAFMASYREAAKLNPFIAVDCEGGRVVRASKFPAFDPTWNAAKIIRRGQTDPNLRVECSVNNIPLFIRIR